MSEPQDPTPGVAAVKAVLANAKPVVAPTPDTPTRDARPSNVVPLAPEKAPGEKAEKKTPAEKAVPDKPAPKKSTPAKDAGPVRRPHRPVPRDFETGLPDGCPVVPLGINGLTRYYLDANRQLIELSAKEHGRLPLQALFGEQSDLVEEFWPRVDKDGFRTGSWKPEDAAKSLMAAAAKLGVFDPHERVRGAGAWRGAAGELVLNCGDAVWIGPTREALKEMLEEADGFKNAAARSDFLERARAGRWIEPGRHGRFVYPGSAPLPRHGVSVDERVAWRKRFDLTKPGDELLKLLKSWNWKRGAIDARLLLGFIGAAMIGGALKWRPMAWITGGAGTGKSTLQVLLDLLFGEGGLIDSADTSAAGVYQTLGRRTLPIAIDELEADADNQRQMAVIKLARLAASGGTMMRGGSDHEAVSFVIRSCFLFSSILIPPLLTQDRSRLAILELDPLAQEAPVPDLPAAGLAALGRALRQRLVEQYWRLDDTVDWYRQALNGEGFNARGQDQFGTLLACADLLLSDYLPDADSDMRHVLALGAVHLQDAAQRAVHELGVLAPLLAFPTQGQKPGETVSLAQCIERLLEVLRVDRADLIGGETSDGIATAKWARDTLRRHGVLLLDVQTGSGAEKLVEGSFYVAVANAHPILSNVYRGTRWNSPSGAEESVWAQGLMRIRGARASKKALWFGLTSRATLIPVSVAIEPQLGADFARNQTSAADGEAVAPPSL